MSSAPAIKIIRSRRKSLCLHISGPDSVTVRAPLRCSHKRIEQFVLQNQSWITRQVEYRKKYPGLPTPDYRPNTALWLLGQPYIIRSKHSPVHQIELGTNELTVTHSDLSEEKLVNKVTRWLRSYAEEYLIQRTAEIVAQAKIPLPEYRCRIRKMKRQWGNCSTTGDIKYNLSLIHYPTECIDYVICHELSHLLHFNHSRAFYEVLETLCPDWHDRKIQLQTFSP